MTDLQMGVLKDLGLNREVFDLLPYAVVGGIYEGSLALNSMAGGGYGWGASLNLDNHIVPHGQQLKILFLRIFTTDTGGAMFEIRQTNPSATGTTGTVEAYPVVGSVPPFNNGATEIRDIMMLEAAGAEVLHGSLKDPIHVLEGSIDFLLMGAQPVPTAWRYGITWWGVQQSSPQPEKDA